MLQITAELFVINALAFMLQFDTGHVRPAEMNEWRMNV